MAEKELHAKDSSEDAGVQLADEVLEQVGGGASYCYNKDSDWYEVYDKDNKLVGCYATEMEAKHVATCLTVDEMSIRELEIEVKLKQGRGIQRVQYKPDTTQ